MELLKIQQERERGGTQNPAREREREAGDDGGDTAREKETMNNVWTME